MFIGHWAPALIAATHPKAPKLGMLFVAAQFVDLLFFSFVLLGIEHVRFVPGISVMNPMDLYDMPYTHSLVGSAGFAALFGGFVWLTSGRRAAGLIAGAVVLSHWFLDLLVHVPDLTLAGSPPKLGLALWNQPAIEMPLELGLTFAGLWLYARVKQPSSLRIGLLGAVLLGLQLFNWLAPVEPAFTPGSAVLALLAYAVATLAAWWVGKSAVPLRSAV